jgi:hypothetical protein
MHQVWGQVSAYCFMQLGRVRNSQMGGFGADQLTGRKVFKTGCGGLLFDQNHLGHASI